MPLTPFHLGPVLPLKLVAPRSFSLGTFAVVQVVIDLEVVYNMVTDAPVLHDRTHTLVGALLVGLLCLVPAKLGLPPRIAGSDRASPPETMYRVVSSVSCKKSRGSARSPASGLARSLMWS